MQNLRDKLLQAGLINESDAKRAETRRPEPRRSEPPKKPEPRERGPAQGRGRGGPSAPRSGPAPIPKLPPLAVPNNKEFQRLEAKRQVELDRQIRELVSSTQVAPESAEHTFYFVTRKNRLRRMDMSPAQAQMLERGELAVVERPDPGQIEHALVPPSTAEKMLELQPKSVRFFNRADAPVGFLTDEELARRHKVEGDRERAEAADPRITPVTQPDDAESDEAPTDEPPPGSEDAAARAERIAAENLASDENAD